MAPPVPARPDPVERGPRCAALFPGRYGSGRDVQNRRAPMIRAAPAMTRPRGPVQPGRRRLRRRSPARALPVRGGRRTLSVTCLHAPAGLSVPPPGRNAC
ncbi:hypothetical protein DBP15_30000 [Streptomyces sp. CS065A]|nr:hypothetical protein DBP15_30000 [Streptomyces sp. CS065A]